MPYFRDVIDIFNPWWYEKFKIKFKDREILKKIKKFMKMRQILVLTGLRRVGKTTIMYKLIHDLIEVGVSPFNIFYFSFDENKKDILELLDTYERITGKNTKKEKVYFFFDEIQRLDDWATQLKILYDTHPNIKIICSGSESLFIRNEAKNILTGRVFEFVIKPLNFREYLLFKGIDYKPIDAKRKMLIREVKNFSISMGFPELVTVSDREIIHKYVRESIIEKIIYKDIPSIFSVKNIETVRSIMDMFLDSPGQLIDFLTISKQFDVSRHSIRNYVRYLENSFLLKRLYNFSKGRRKMERKLRKIYPTLISPNLLFSEDRIHQSKVFEWLIVNQSDVKFFWRDKYKNEVDMVIDEIPYEIKYGGLSTKGVERFMEKFKAKKGYIITWDEERLFRKGRKNIYAIPSFKYLLTST